MDDLILLSDDHALLMSQVKHVMALTHVYGERSADGAQLREETLKQSKELRSQLEAHFAFEETTIFPKLEVEFPGAALRIQQLVTSHGQVLRALEEYLGELKLERPHSAEPRLLDAASAFEREFQAHVDTEAALFLELAGQVLRTRA